MPATPAPLAQVSQLQGRINRRRLEIALCVLLRRTNSADSAILCRINRLCPLLCCACYSAAFSSGCFLYDLPDPAHYSGGPLESICPAATQPLPQSPIFLRRCFCQAPLQTALLASPSTLPLLCPLSFGLNPVLQQARGWGPVAWAYCMPTRQEKRRARQNRRLDSEERQAASIAPPDAEPQDVTVETQVAPPPPVTSLVEEAAQAICEALSRALLCRRTCDQSQQFGLSASDLWLLTYVRWPGRPPPTTYLRTSRSKREMLHHLEPSAPVSTSTTERSRSPRLAPTPKRRLGASPVAPLAEPSASSGPSGGVPDELAESIEITAGYLILRSRGLGLTRL